MTTEKVTSPIESAPDEVREIILSVLRLEKERLYEDKPRLVEDIKRIVEENVK